MNEKNHPKLKIHQHKPNEKMHTLVDIIINVWQMVWKLNV